MTSDHLLHLPERVLDDVEQLLCDDVQQQFAAAIEQHLQFMRMRGQDDPYTLEQLRADYIKQHGPARQRLLDTYLEAIPAYLRQHGVSLDEFAQAWALMGGVWNVVEFTRIRPIVALQQTYPQLLEVARRVGRVADEKGPERVPVSGGSSFRTEHSAPSDIEGIGVGNDLTSLLPTELAMLADEQLSPLFAYRFATRRLQTFQYKSNLLKAARRVTVQHARQKGPIVVCLDTSGSMQGPPERIAHSLIVKLLQLALAQDRDMLLVAFSDAAKTFDVRRNRTHLLDFLRQQGGGDTDGDRMLEAVFAALGTEPYAAADVLLISDFKFGVPAPRLRRQLDRLKDEGTRFYGLEIGIAEAAGWKALLTTYWHLEYKLQMRPGYMMK